MILTHSSTMTLLECPAKYHLTYVQRRRPKAFRGALSVGKAVHKGCEIYTGDNFAEASMHAGLTLSQEIAAAEEHGATGIDAARHATLLAALWQGWVKHLGLPPGISAREKTVYAQLDDFVVAGVIDAGMPIHDYKTTSESVAGVSVVLQSGLQLATYRWILDDKNDSTVDVIKKPVIKKRKDESWHQWGARAIMAYDADPLRFFARITVPYSAKREAEMISHYRSCARMIRHHRRHGWPRCWGHGCRSPWGWCEYRPLCWYGDDDRYYVSDTEHDELGGLTT